MVKNIRLSWLHTIINYKLLYLFVVRKFHVFNFRRTAFRQKFFHTEFFSNDGICVCVCYNEHKLLN